MRINPFFLMITLILISCNQKIDKVSSNYEKEVNQLATNEAKKVFLEKILEDDQQVRNNEKEAEIIAQYGYNSREHMDLAKAMWKQDEINLQKIEAYLAKYGYPKVTELGKDAAIAPWLIIHHSVDIGIRNKYFKILYEAYLTEDINHTELAMYLGRTYSFTFRERFDIESPYQPEDEINQLIQALGLEVEQANVLERMK